MNPFTFYQPPTPVTLGDAVPFSSDNGVTIAWDPAQGNVLSYTIYRNGSAIATVPATQLSYTDSSVSLDLTDPNDSDFPYYQIAANYSSASYLADVEYSSNPRFTIAAEIVRGAGGQQILLVPNIPYGVTAIRVYVSPLGANFPDDVFNSLSYAQPNANFNPSVSNYFDVAVGSFTNGQYAVPASLLPPYDNYTISCRALGPNGTFGPDESATLDSAIFVADSEIPAFVPFVDGTEQMKENLAYELESADEDGPLAFGVESSQSPEPPDYAFPPNYACAGFTFPYDFGETQLNYSFIDPFKPFEDNYFLRNFVFAFTNVNSDGSLVSGAYYNASTFPPIQIPQTTLFSFPEYPYVSTGNTNYLTPQMSATSNQWMYSGYEPGSPGQGNIGISESGTNLSLGSGQYNIFGLEYQSAYRLYFDGVSPHTNTLIAGGGSIPDKSAYGEYFYGQVTPPQLQTVGYLFGVPFQDYLPGNAGFNPTNTGPAEPQVIAVGQSLLMTAWAKERIANSASGAIGFLEQYFDRAYLADANGNIDTNLPTGILSEYGEFFDTQAGKTVLTTKADTSGNQGQLPIYSIGLFTDVNRDGTIDPSFGSPDFTTPAHPFHFWVNDNNDSGTTDGNDIPGYPATMKQTPNGLSGQINGVRDLIDFFPVYIDVHDLLEVMQTNQLYSGLQFRLSQTDSALNFAYTTIEPTQPESYLTDTNVGFPLANSQVTQITSSGIILDTNYLDFIRGGNIGILLVEAWTNTSNPLVLDVLQGTNVICETALYLNITGVEQMFRQKNLTGVIEGEIAGPADRTNDFDVPNEPDTDGNNFIFVHGYSVNPNEARGWHSAMFRRMFWSGSQAKFYGVTWDGYASMQNLLGLIEFTPNYETNVVTAFLTAPYLASFINSLQGTNTLAGHSLGNMVSLSTLSDWNANVQTYFMIDAACAMEAIDPSTEVNTNMIPSAWLNYDSRLWASYWYELWPSGDNRNLLAWNGRLDNFHSASVYNFYSSGEQVLRTWPGGSIPSSLLGIAFNQIKLFLHDESGFYVWAWQELMKGQMSYMLNNTILSSDHGGWRANSAYSSLTYSQADDLPTSELQTNAFFDFSNTSFTVDLTLEGASGSAYAGANRNRIISDAIPAVTLPIGANPVGRLAPAGQPDRNINMSTATFENGWPITTGTEAFNWHHSDCKTVAYTFTYQLFNQMVLLGNLQ